MVLCAVSASRSSVRERGLFGSSFFESALATRLRCLEAAELIFRLVNEPRDFDWLSVPVDRNERQVARIRMPATPCLEILGFDSDADLHRSASDVIHAALHDDEIAEVNRLTKIDSVDGCGDAGTPRVPDRADCGRGVHHCENDAPEHQAEIVRVLGQHQLGCLVLSLANRARFDGWAH